MTSFTSRLDGSSSFRTWIIVGAVAGGVALGTILGSVLSGTISIAAYWTMLGIYIGANFLSSWAAKRQHSEFLRDMGEVEKRFTVANAQMERFFSGANVQ
jgi:hypothetical protein